MKEEMVLVVRRTLFEKLGTFQGLNLDVHSYLPGLLARENNLFVPRSSAESDPTFKQLIPYVILTHGGKVLHYVRGKKAGEQRLVAKGSIGIGGHINEQDEGLFAMNEEAYREAVHREIHEELRLESTYRDHMVALLNDDSNEVGKVHLGVVHVFVLERPEVRKGEAMITDLQFLSPEELRQRSANLESWSQICLDRLDDLLAVVRDSTKP